MNLIITASLEHDSNRNAFASQGISRLDNMWEGPGKLVICYPLSCSTKYNSNLVPHPDNMGDTDHADEEISCYQVAIFIHHGLAI